VWFTQAEAQFFLASISSEKTKFCHVISQLDHRYAAELENIITELRQHMARLRPVPVVRHASPAKFVHSSLEKYTHIFLRQDMMYWALEPP
jgi:hypothetical protein